MICQLLRKSRQRDYENAYESGKDQNEYSLSDRLQCIFANADLIADRTVLANAVMVGFDGNIEG